MERRQRFVAQALLLAMVGVAAVLFLAPGFPPPADLRDMLLQRDTLAHAAIFGAIGLVVPHVFLRTPRFLLWEALLLAAGAAEVVQYLVPGRDASWSDLLGNALGTLTVLLPIPRRRDERVP